MNKTQLEQEKTSLNKYIVYSKSINFSNDLPSRRDKRIVHPLISKNKIKTNCNHKSGYNKPKNGGKNHE